MKSCTVPLAYGVERFARKRAEEVTVWNAPIFQAAPPWLDHWRCTSSICVASYTPAISTLPCSQASARVPMIGPEVITGEHTQTRFSADAIERDITHTILTIGPAREYRRTRVA